MNNRPALYLLPSAPTDKTGWPWTKESPPLPDTMPDDKTWPKISIVTPSYNQGRFLEETIRSVLLQGYPNLEYIIIDGGSTDNSVEVIKKYEQGLSYWVSEPDQGQSDAINKGWNRSSGEIMAYLNSDDLYTPGAVAEAVTYFQNFPECAVIHGQTMVTDENGKDMKIFGAPFDLQSSIDGCNDPVAQQSAFIRKDVLRDIGFMDITLHKAMDYDLWLRIAVKYPFHFVPRIWSKFRSHSRSKTMLNITLRSDCLEIMEKIYALPYLPEEIIYLKKRAFAWAHLFKAQEYIDIKKPWFARWHAFKALLLNKDVCLKRGVELFIQAALNKTIFERMRLIKKLIMGWRKPSKDSTT